MEYGISKIANPSAPPSKTCARSRIWLAGFETTNISRWVSDPGAALAFSTAEEARELKIKKNLKGSILQLK